MAEEGAAKTSELSELTQVLAELREAKEGKKRKPWVFTEARAANFARANAKRAENAEKRRRQEADRLAFEAERKAFYEMQALKPTGQLPSSAPDLSVNTMTPNKMADPPAPEAPRPSEPASNESETSHAKTVRFIEKPIMADEVESVAGEHDHDDGWMTSAQTAKFSSHLAEQLPRQTNEAAVREDMAKHELSDMHNRKRLRETRGPYPVGTGAGNHAPYEGDEDYGEPTHRPAFAPGMVTSDEALLLLSMPKTEALRILAQRMAQQPAHATPMTPYRSRYQVQDDMPMEPTPDDYLTHTRHYSARHPSQLHNSTSSSRYSAPSGDGFLWL